MPVTECTLDGKPGYKWGEAGHCYVYTAGDPVSRTRAHNKATQQGQAIHASGGKSADDKRPGK